jgi:hypothetical protein
MKNNEKVYNSPKLKKLGTIADMTQGTPQMGIGDQVWTLHNSQTGEIISCS